MAAGTLYKDLLLEHFRQLGVIWMYRFAHLALYPFQVGCQRFQ